MNTNVTLQIHEDVSTYIKVEYVDEKDNESCGIFFTEEKITDNTTHPIWHSEPPTVGDAISCAHHGKQKYACQWHSHPEHTAKWYPSINDIMTMRKKRPLGDRIRVSLIYTTQGIWVLHQRHNASSNLPEITKESIYEYHKHLTRIYLLGSKRIQDLYAKGIRVFPRVQLTHKVRAPTPDNTYVHRPGDLPGKVKNAVVMKYIHDHFIPFIETYFGVHVSFHDYDQTITIVVSDIIASSLSRDGCPDKTFDENKDESNRKDIAIISAYPNPNEEVIFSYNMDTSQLTGRKKRLRRTRLKKIKRSKRGSRQKVH